MKLYALFEIKDNDSFLLTIAKNKQQVRAYARAFLRLNNMEHFKLWCDLRQIDYKDELSWDEYMRTCIPEEILLQYRIKKLCFTKDKLAETCRLAANLLPIGLPYEGDIEYKKFENIIRASKEDPSFIKEINDIATFNDRLAKILVDLNLK